MRCKVQKLVTRFQQPSYWVTVSTLYLTRKAAKDNLKWLRKTYPKLAFRVATTSETSEVIFHG